MTLQGYDLINKFRNADADTLLSYNPREIAIHAEYAQDSVKKPEFFDFQTAEDLRLNKADVAKQIEQDALNGKINVPFNFNKFHKVTGGGNYTLLYDALKAVPDIVVQRKAKEARKRFVEAIQQRASELLKAGAIDRTEFNKIYRNSYYGYLTADKSVQDYYNKNKDSSFAKSVVVGNEMFAGMVQDVLGVISDGISLINSLGANIDDTGLKANINHYANTMRTLQHITGDEGNSFLTWQNAGSLLLGVGAGGIEAEGRAAAMRLPNTVPGITSLGKVSSVEASNLTRLSDYVANTIIGAGIGHASAIGRGFNSDEAEYDALLGGLIGGVGMTSITHGAQNFFKPKYDKLEESLTKVLGLTEEEKAAAAKEYAKYMDVPENSAEARVNGILMTKGVDLAQLVKDAARGSQQDIINLKNYIKARKEFLFDKVNDIDVDNLTFGSRIKEAKALMVNEWGAMLNRMRNRLGEAFDNTHTNVEALTKEEQGAINTLDDLADNFGQATRHNSTIVRDALENPTISNLLDADSALGKILSKNIDPKKAYNLKQIQNKIKKSISDTLEASGNHDLLHTWEENRAMYKVISTAEQAKVTNVLMSDLSAEAKLQQLSTMKIGLGDLQAIREVVGDKSALELEKAILKSALGTTRTSTLAKSWEMIFKSAGKKQFVTPEGKMLMEFIDDMNKHFELDDILTQNINRRNQTEDMGLRTSAIAQIKASMLGKLGSFIVRHTYGLIDRKFYHDIRIQDLLSYVYNNPARLKQWRASLNSMDGGLINRLREKVYFGIDDDLPPKPSSNGPKGNKPSGSPKGGEPAPEPDYPTPALMPSPESPLSIGGDIAVNSNGKTESMYEGITKQKNIKLVPKIVSVTPNIAKRVKPLQRLLSSFNYNTLEIRGFVDRFVDNLPDSFIKSEFKEPSKFASPKEIRLVLKRELYKYIDTNLSQNKIDLRPDIELKASTNPTYEMELLKDHKIYLNLLGEPVEAPDTLGEALKILQDKKIKYKPASAHSKKPKITYDDKSGIWTVEAKPEEAIQLASALKDTQSIESVLKTFKPIKLPKSNILSDEEIRILNTGYNIHPILDIVNKHGMNLMDYFRKGDTTITKRVFEVKNEKMLPIIKKIRSKSVALQDLPELRALTAFNHLNPTYTSNPFVAEHYGLKVDWNAVDSAKISKYKKVYEEAKAFKVLATAGALTGIIEASNNPQAITVNRLIKNNEGISLVPYKDIKGNWTIGFGHKLRQGELEKFKKGITREQAETLFRQDLAWTQARLRDNLKFWNSLPNNVKIALTDMGFNLGIRGVLKFKKMLGALAVKNYNMAIREVLNSKYYEELPHRAIKVINLMKNRQV